MLNLSPVRYLFNLLQASRILLKLVEPIAVQKSSIPSDTTPFVFDEASISEPASPVRVVDYSNLFGEEFQIPDDHWDSSYLNVLDIRAVEEGVLHVLYSCASQVGQYQNCPCRNQILLIDMLPFLPSSPI